MDLDYSKLTFQHLQYFVKIAELGKMRKAAEELFVTQPLLSQKVNQLETALGIQLFTRYKQRLSLTEAGEQFLRDCKEILCTMDDKLVHLKSSYGMKEPVFSIGFSSGQNSKAVNRIVHSIKEANPDFDFSVEVENLYKTQNNVLNGETDFAFCLFDSRQPKLEGVSWQIIYQGKVCFVMSKTLFEKTGGRLSFEKLSKYPFIISQNRKNGSFEQDIFQVAQEKNVQLKVKYLDSDLISLNNYVALNDCYTVALKQKPDREELIYCPIEEIEPYPFLFVWNPGIEKRFPELIDSMYQCALDILSEDI